MPQICAARRSTAAVPSVSINWLNKPCVYPAMYWTWDDKRRHVSALPCHRPCRRSSANGMADRPDHYALGITKTMSVDHTTVRRSSYFLEHETVEFLNRITVIWWKTHYSHWLLSEKGDACSRMSTVRVLRERRREFTNEYCSRMSTVWVPVWKAGRYTRSSGAFRLRRPLDRSGGVWKRGAGRPDPLSLQRSWPVCKEKDPPNREGHLAAIAVG
jgi:hypothetical protein